MNQLQIMNQKQIDENFSISGQITLNEIKLLADTGVRVLVCNRPDNEETDQLSFLQIKTEAEKFGITSLHIPVVDRNIPETELTDFCNLLDNENRKIHAYCRTGARCSVFWALSYARTHSTQETLNKAQSLGYDLSQVADQIDKLGLRNSPS